MFGLDSDQSLNLLYLALLLAFILAFGSRRGSIGGALRSLALWAVIGLGLVTAYAYREPILRFAQPVLAELDPSRAVEVTTTDGEAELIVRRAPDGHFHLDADVNGEPVRFLVDTGASSTVLTLEDAERSGIETETLEFNRPVQTANGVTFYARATLRSLEIGPFRLTGVPVGVMRPEALTISLLGMNTIDRFSGWRVEGERMVLVP